MGDFNLFYLEILFFPLVPALVLCALYFAIKRRFLKGAMALIMWNLALAMVLLSGVAVIGETYCRFFVDTTDSFGLSITNHRWKRRHWQLNNFHIRDNIDYQHRIENGKRRITFIGDSFTAGTGVSDINNRFANIIRSNNVNLEAHALAIGGAETNTQLKLLTELWQDYEIHVVVLMYGLNDISYLVEEGKDILERVYNYERNLTKIQRESYLVNTLTYRWIAVKDPVLSNYFDFVQKSYFDREQWQSHSRNLLAVKAEVEKRGGTFMVTTFPFFHQIDAKEYSFYSVHSRLDSLWSANDVPHLDLLSAFSGFSSDELVVNSMDAHPNETAHEIVANELEAFLKENANLVMGQ